MKVFPKVSSPLLLIMNSHSITTGLLLFFSHCVRGDMAVVVGNVHLEPRSECSVEKAVTVGEWLIECCVSHDRREIGIIHLFFVYVKRMSHVWQMSISKNSVPTTITVPSYSGTQTHLSLSYCIFYHNKSCERMCAKNWRNCNRYSSHLYI